MFKIFAASMLSLVIFSAHAGPLVVYSERRAHLIEPLLERYTEITGQEVQLLTDSAGVLIERMAAEGKNTRADILLTVDAGNLWLADQRDVLQAINSQTLQNNVPENLRDLAAGWTSLSIRARTLVYSTQRVSPDMLTSYADLADAKWQGKLCLRTSKKVYNQSLVAKMIANMGEENTEATVNGWISNLAAEPFSNDTRMLEAIAAGACDVGISNSYYLGRLLKENPEFPVTVFFPAAANGGTHINVSGAGLSKHSHNKDKAIALIEWLSGTEAQAMFANLNMEFTVNKDAMPHPIVAKWGNYEMEAGHLRDAGKLQTQAISLMDRAEYR